MIIGNNSYYYESDTTILNSGSYQPPLTMGRMTLLRSQLIVFNWFSSVDRRVETVHVLLIHEDPCRRAELLNNVPSVRAHYHSFRLIVEQAEEVTHSKVPCYLYPVLSFLCLIFVVYLVYIYYKKADIHGFVVYISIQRLKNLCIINLCHYKPCSWRLPHISE